MCCHKFVEKIRIFTLKLIDSSSFILYDSASAAKIAEEKLLKQFLMIDDQALMVQYEKYD